MSPTAARRTGPCFASFDTSFDTTTKPSRHGGSMARSTVTDDPRPFYRRALHMLNGSGIPYLIGGAFGLTEYTGIVRRTKDLDAFVRPTDWRPVVDLFASAGLETEVTDPMWLVKARGPDGAFLDFIFRS